MTCVKQKITNRAAERSCGKEGDLYQLQNNTTPRSLEVLQEHAWYAVITKASQRLSLSKVLQLCCSSSTGWRAVCRGEEVKTEEPGLSLEHGSGVGQILAGCLACTSELLEGSLLRWVVLSRFPSFPGGLCEGSCCWPFCLGPWLHLSCSHTE